MPTTTPGSSNPFPSVLLVEGSAPPVPASGKQRLFVDIADGLLKLRDDAGTVTAVGSFATPTLDAVIAASSGQDVADALDGAAAPDAGNVFATIADVGGAITVADEGSPLSTAATTLDFVGAGVTASGTGATKTITISGGGGGGGGADDTENQIVAMEVFA